MPPRSSPSPADLREVRVAYALGFPANPAPPLDSLTVEADTFGGLHVRSQGVRIAYRDGQGFWWVKRLHTAGEDVVADDIRAVRAVLETSTYSQIPAEHTGVPGWSRWAPGPPVVKDYVDA